MGVAIGAEFNPLFDTTVPCRYAKGRWPCRHKRRCRYLACRFTTPQERGRIGVAGRLEAATAQRNPISR